MARFCVKIGYAETVETEPGLWGEHTTERMHYGDLIRNRRNLQNSNSVNDDINISNELSIIADPYAINHFHAMRYAEIMGAKWKITSVDVQYPRLILSLGGVYNGESLRPTE